MMWWMQKADSLQTFQSPGACFGKWNSSRADCFFCGGGKEGVMVHVETQFHQRDHLVLVHPNPASTVSMSRGHGGTTSNIHSAQSAVVTASFVYSHSDVTRSSFTSNHRFLRERIDKDFDQAERNSFMDQKA
jgi:hypothetical protein